MEYYILYPIFASVPCWFIVYSFLRIKVHFRDGVDRIPHRPKCFAFKLIATLLMSWITIFHLGEVCELTIRAAIPQANAVLISVYLTISALAWFLSCFMVNFEFKKKLVMEWKGQRLFWIGSCLLYSVVLTSSILENDHSVNAYLRFVTYSFGALFTLLLALLAVFRPNEFHIDSFNYPQMKTFLLSSSMGMADSNTVSVRIRTFKLKHIDGKSQVQYYLLVNIDRELYDVRRTYADFDDLHKRLGTCPTDGTVGRPQLPQFTKNEAIEKRMQLLEEYINLLKADPLSFTEDFLNFLEVPSPYRENLGRARALALANDSSPRLCKKGYSEYELAESAKTTHSFVDLSVIIIPESVQQIHWKTSTHSGTVQRTFSDLKHLHHVLKLACPRPPKFPKQVTDYEQYLVHIFNDPAYHCEALLSFAEIPLSLHEFWKMNGTVFDYDLVNNASWETVYTEKSSFHRFNFTINKSFGGLFCKQWNFSRRYSEFRTLHKHLSERYKSAALAKFLSERGEVSRPIPELTGRTISSLDNVPKLDERRNKLFHYLGELVKNPAIKCAVEFKMFVNETGY